MPIMDGGSVPVSSKSWPPDKPGHSARINGHEPCAYLKDVLQRLPTHPASRVDELWQRHALRVAHGAAVPSALLRVPGDHEIRAGVERYYCPRAEDLAKKPTGIAVAKATRSLGIQEPGEQPGLLLRLTEVAALIPAAPPTTGLGSGHGHAECTSIQRQVAAKAKAARGSQPLLVVAPLRPMR